MQQPIQLYQTQNGPCPYRPEGVWENIAFEVPCLSGEMYEALLNNGFRRSGYSIYRPACQGCHRCIPLRVDTQRFAMTKSQRRTWRKNQDLSIEHHSVGFTEESFELYQHYQMQWHHSDKKPNIWEFQSFLLESPVETEMICYYFEKILIGVSWIDRLPTSLSSVYFIFHPDFAARRLGVYSILYEIAYCCQLNHPWLYLGFWVEDSPKMKYKAEYQPAQILLNEQWQSLQAPPSLMPGISPAKN